MVVKAKAVLYRIDNAGKWLMFSGTIEMNLAFSVSVTKKTFRHYSYYYSWLVVFCKLFFLT